MIDRRRFIWTVGRGALAVGVLGVAACGDSGDGSPTTAPAGAGVSGTSAVPGTAVVAADGELTWARASFVFVSAYVLERGGRAVVVDTGVEGSEDGLEEALAGLDLGWAEVDHVVLTHHHPDHAGSIGAAADLAPAATLYAGEADISAISAPRDLVAVGDGSEVMGLTVIETPGHTPGSISLLDAGSGVLVVGDALSGGEDGSTVTGSNPEFTDDAAMAQLSVSKLAGLDFETILFGHGEPVLTGGSSLLAAYAASLSSGY